MATTRISATSAVKLKDFKDIDRTFTKGSAIREPYTPPQEKAEAYGRLGITLNPLSEGIRRKVTKEELIENETLYDIIGYGNLRDHVLDMVGIEDAQLAISRLFTDKTKAYHIRAKGDGFADVFVKENGMEPDVLAVRLLRKAGIIVPDVRNVWFELPDGQERQYGIMRDIAEAERVRRAMSLRAMARDERMSQLVLADLDGFARMLGHAFEVCRKLGIQDRHARNVFLIEKDDGELAIGMIDLDLVACYPHDIRFETAFMGQLSMILDSIYFASRYGELVRTKPEIIGEVLCSEDEDEKMDMKAALRDSIRHAFVGGAGQGHGFYCNSQNALEVYELFRGHHGLPVGWRPKGSTLDMLLGIRESTHALCDPINGRVQDLIPEGPNAGRFLLDWTDAWEKGFIHHIGRKVGDFWKEPLDHAHHRASVTLVY